MFRLKQKLILLSCFPNKECVLTWDRTICSPNATSLHAPSVSVNLLTLTLPPVWLSGLGSSQAPLFQKVIGPSASSLESWRALTQTQRNIWEGLMITDSFWFSLVTWVYDVVWCNLGWHDNRVGEGQRELEKGREDSPPAHPMKRKQ